MSKFSKLKLVVLSGVFTAIFGLALTGCDSNKQATKLEAPDGIDWDEIYAKNKADDEQASGKGEER